MTTVTYAFYDMLTNAFLGEIPMSGVSYQDQLNGAGTFSGTINIRDPRVKGFNPTGVALPGRTIMHAIVNGSIDYSGIVWTQDRSSDGTMKIGGAQLESIFSHWQQTRDYSAHWPGFLNSTSGTSSGGTLTQTSTITSPLSNLWITNNVPPPAAAAQMIADCIYDQATALRQSNALTSSTSGSSLYVMPVNVHYVGGYPAGAYWTNEKYPKSSRQTLAQILANLSTEHINTGFDFAVSATLSAGKPVYSFDITWPRGGSNSGQSLNASGLAVIDQQDIESWSYSLDASQMANRIFAVSGGVKGARQGSGDVMYGTTWAGGNVYFDVAIPIGTALNIYHGGTAYNCAVTKCVYQGSTYGYKYKVIWSGGTPGWVASALQSAVAVVIGSPSDVTRSGGAYPPMTKSSSYTHVKSAGALEKVAMGELAHLEWPVATADVTVIASGPVGWGTIAAGDDVRWTMPASDNFPAGIDAIYRVQTRNVTISEAGASTIKYTLAMPPSQSGTGLPALAPVGA